MPLKQRKKSEGSLELLALVLFNIVFGVILYFVLSVKVASSVRDYQIVKLKKEIQAHTLDFFKESESYLALMDSRITIFKNLIQKAENMGLDFNQTEKTLPTKELKSNDFSSKDLLEKFTEERERIINTAQEIKAISSTPLPKNPPKQVSPPTPEESSGLLGGIGKIFRSILGIDDPKERLEEMITNSSSEKILGKPNTHGVDYSVGGNPLLEKEKVLDNNRSVPPFQKFVEGISEKPQIFKDKLLISPKAALAEIPPGAPKIDKVVHLLKKGFSHSEISEELGLAIPEISLIETIKLERNRRV